MPLKKSEVESLEKVTGQLAGLHNEISQLARKAPNDAVNKFKLGFINSIVSSANAVLGDEYKPLDGFVQFDADEVPSNSDVTLIIGLYLEEVERLRSDNIKMNGGAWVYDLFKSDERIRTSAPAKVRKK